MSTDKEKDCDKMRLHGVLLFVLGFAQSLDVSAALLTASSMGHLAYASSSRNLKCQSLTGRLRISTISSAFSTRTQARHPCLAATTRRLTDLWCPMLNRSATQSCVTAVFFSTKPRPAPSPSLLFSSLQGLSFPWKLPRHLRS